MRKIFFLLLGVLATANAFAITPADPTEVTWHDCGDESGMSYLNFTLPTVDVDGNLLDFEMMGYRIYIDDDQIFTFNSAQYDGLWGSETNIYYHYWDEASDLRSNRVYFYRTNAEGFDRFFENRIGIQVFYLNNNFSIGGTSNIVYAYLDSPVTELPKPMNPVIDYWEEAWGDSQNFMFTVWPYTEDWEPLDEDCLSWSLFLDNDELFVFTPEEFPSLTEPLSEVPLGLNAGNLSNTEIWFENRQAITATENPFFTWRIGMQVYYTVGDQRVSTDICYLEVFPQMHEAAEVSSTSFLADWSSEPNCYQHAGFLGYDLYVIDKATGDTTVIADVPFLTQDDPNWGKINIPGSTYLVEDLTPGATYQYYVVSRHQWGQSVVSIPSVVREVTLPGGDDHGYELGDVNHDHSVSIADVTALIDYLLGGDNGACLICADVNGEGGVTIADVTALIDKLLSGGN